MKRLFSSSSAGARKVAFIFAALVSSSLFLLGGIMALNGIQSTQAAPQNVFSSTIRAPEFPSTFKWLNTDKPLSLRGLQGKIVLLDFWTYGCINCMNILPDLKKLERKYPNELVIVGVHSAKFENEKDASNIRNIVMRYNIEHPVLVDQNMRVWESYAVRAWPTLVLIDPAGRVVTQVAGEGHYNELDQAIDALATKFRKAGQLNTTPLRFALEAAQTKDSLLWYPGKVLADAASNRIFIADSNHNRIVIADMQGRVQAVAGTGVVGFTDGSFATSTFHNPQGMALRRNADGSSTVFIADTNNHAIRALDLKNNTVKTIAGIGKQAAWRSSGGVGTKAALASPWDLQLVGDTLYIAMAGPHQIWAMDLKTAQVGLFAGTGREARIDGTRNSAGFAQPSGLATDGKVLFVADSEISAIRSVALPDFGDRVQTVAGGDLFDFGDRDGIGNAVRLQHPLGVAWHGAPSGPGVLYLADTYNNKIKTLDPATGRVATFLGSGRGDRDGANPQFYEPGGLSITDDKLFVADTNNHKIRVVDLKTKTSSTFPLINLPKPLPAEPQRAPEPKVDEKGTITLQQVALAPNNKGELVLEVQLPAGYKLNKEAPQRFQARVEGTGVVLGQSTILKEQFKLPLRVPISSGQPGTRGTVVVSTTIAYCTDNEGLCKFESLRFKAPFEVKEGGQKQLTLSARLP